MTGTFDRRPSFSLAWGSNIALFKYPTRRRRVQFIWVLSDAVREVTQTCSTKSFAICHHRSFAAPPEGKVSPSFVLRGGLLQTFLFMYFLVPHIYVPHSPPFLPTDRPCFIFYFRKHAPIAMGAAGTRVVVAESYARIFFRNSMATGEVSSHTVSWV